MERFLRIRRVHARKSARLHFELSGLRLRGFGFRLRDHQNSEAFTKRSGELGISREALTNYKATAHRDFALDVPASDGDPDPPFLGNGLEIFTGANRTLLHYRRQPSFPLRTRSASKSVLWCRPCTSGCR